MLQVYLKEVRLFLHSLIAYVVIGTFLLLQGLLLWVFPETNLFDYGYADLSTYFSLSPYVFLFLIPAITMRSLAEEKKEGTIELLLTKPLSDGQIIMSKFFAAWTLVIFALIPTAIFYVSVYLLGNPAGNIDSAAYIGSMTGLLLLAAVYCAIGILAGSFTTNQIVAFIMASLLCFIFFSGFDSISKINPFGEGAVWIERTGLLYHYDALSRGLIDTRNVVYLISLCAFFLMISKLSLSSRKW
ncbi:MAG: gliding motility-associated ABC transporter permease subunit GldF [Cyclobacteriaceae bacterium]|nr:gliding motility-associated ABC transporter permease subunit GldF [Cyclobacteriaceae bacterium]MCH8515732.1 gliding motility-associated ABC transporter permease subunit GldF [Cyclobacteriaceae bacterium]